MVFYSLLLIILMLTRPQGIVHVEAHPQNGGARMSAAAATEPLLQLEHCTLRFGGLTAVSDLTLAIGVSTTSLASSAPTARAKPRSSISSRGSMRQRKARSAIAAPPSPAKGPTRSPPMVSRARSRTSVCFRRLTVFDNVRVAFHLHLEHDARHSLWRGRGFVREEKEIDGQVMEMLEIFHLGQLRDTPAKSLPYGDQRRLEIVRALATRPRLLLLDEPAAGMNPTEKGGLMKLDRVRRAKIPHLHPSGRTRHAGGDGHLPPHYCA
jgi:branched-chain amino acid transport system ATP-binding protein